MNSAIHARTVLHEINTLGAHFAGSEQVKGRILDEMQAAVNAAHSDSNDDEIEALWELVNTLSTLTGVDIPEDPEACRHRLEALTADQRNMVACSLEIDGRADRAAEAVVPGFIAEFSYEYLTPVSAKAIELEGLKAELEAEIARIGVQGTIDALRAPRRTATPTDDPILAAANAAHLAHFQALANKGVSYKEKKVARRDEAKKLRADAATPARAAVDTQVSATAATPAMVTP